MNRRKELNGFLVSSRHLSVGLVESWLFVFALTSSISGIELLNQFSEARFMCTRVW